MVKSLETKSVSELKQILTKLNVKDTNIKGTGKNGYITKSDRILAIQDYYATHSKRKTIKVSSPKTLNCGDNKTRDKYYRQFTTCNTVDEFLKLWAKFYK